MRRRRRSPLHPITFNPDPSPTVTLILTPTLSQGCLWNFPGANTTHWHRDYPFDEDWQLLTVITAAADYPQDVGWLLLQVGVRVGAS